MICKNCNQQINATDMHCPHCGTVQEINPIGASQPSIIPNPNYGATPKQAPKYGKGFMLGGILLAIVAALIYFWPNIQEYLDKGNDDDKTNTGEKTNTNQPKNETVLSDEIDLDEEGAELSCILDTKYLENDYARKVVIFADEDGIITQIMMGEILLADEDTIEAFKEYIYEDLDEMMEYGDVSYFAVTLNNRLTLTVEMDMTNFDMESYVKIYEEMMNHLNEDYKFTLTSIKKMYEDQEFNCTLK